MINKCFSKKKKIDDKVHLDIPDFKSKDLKTKSSRLKEQFLYKKKNHSWIRLLICELGS